MHSTVALNLMVPVTHRCPPSELIFRTDCSLHKSCTPLASVDLDETETCCLKSVRGFAASERLLQDDPKKCATQVRTVSAA